MRATAQKSPESKRVARAKPASVVEAPDPVNVTFVLHETRARQVFLCGEFNRWSVAATPLKRRQDGNWETTIALRPGRYEYKYVVDGNWRNDPQAQQVPDPFGGFNSVIEVVA